MPKLVVNGAGLKCDQGVAPGKLIVLPALQGDINGQPIATIMDHVPMANIPPFGMCKTQANPMVAAATVAAMGVLTPMPCIPVTASPWSSGSSMGDLRGLKLLTDECKCMCQWAGQIEITDPGSDVEIDS